jgi:hypothetical protein
MDLHHRLLGKYALLTPAVAFGLILQVTVSRADAELDLARVGDADAASALISGFNLPTVSRETAPSRTEDWARAIALEQQRLAALLRAYGYLAATIDVSAAGASSASVNSGPGPKTGPDVRLKAIPGPLYRIGAVRLGGLSSDELPSSVQEDIRDVLPRFTGKAARADVISNMEDEITWRIRNAAHPFVKVAKREISLDQATHLAEVHLEIDPGQFVRLGSVVFRGLIRVDPAFLVKYAPFSPGDPYRPKALTSFEEALQMLPYFRRVTVRLADMPQANGLWNAEVKVQEAPPEFSDVSRAGMPDMLAIGGGLALLGLRQMILAAYPAARVKLLNVLVIALLTASLWLAGERMILLASLS